MRSVLLVCTANICRSAFAHRMLQWMLPDLTVRSAGVAAMVGHPVEKLMAAELARRGVSAEGHSARQIQASDLTADLILVMSPSHRTVLLEEWPEAVGRIGLMSTVASLRAQAGAALSTADVAQWARGSFTDEGVPDPYRQGRRAAAEAAASLTSYLEHLADQIVPEHLAHFLDEPSHPAAHTGWEQEGPSA